MTRKKKPEALYLHCGRCLNEIPEGESPETWARLNVSASKDGELRVHCVRHNLPVVTLMIDAVSISMLAPLMHCHLCASGVEHEHTS